MMSVTAQAAAQIKIAADRSGASGMPLRLAAKRDGDGSIQYGMGFDEQNELDRVAHSAGVVLLVSPDSHALLQGVVIDFVELNPGEFRFIFINPNEAGSSCDGADPGSAAGGDRQCGGCNSGCE